MLYWFPRPGCLEDRQGFVEHPGAPAVVDFLARCRELACVPIAAKSDAERQPPAAQHIERGRLARDLCWPAASQRRYEWAEPNSLGACRDRCQRDLGVADCLHGLAPADLVPEEEPVPAGLLRLACEARHDRWVS